MKEPIRIEGARTHNLRGVSCTFPAEALTVVTGPSGSGKSSLVFDTLYAEGQRRFVQSLSTYTRLFLDRMERPDVDFIGNIPPAIALAQKNAIRNARSTVGTITEINDFLRLLFTHLGETSCLACGGRVARDDPGSAVERIVALPAGSVVLVTAPVETAGLPLGDVAESLARHAHRRVLHGERTYRLDDAESLTDLAGALVAAESPEPGSLAAAARERGEPAPRVPISATLDVVVDRLVVGSSARSRMREALESAFQLGRGRVRLVAEGEGMALDRRFSCRACGREHAEPAPHLFSFNSPLGACPVCEGFGRVTGIDFEKVIPDHRKSIAGGAVVPFQTPANLEIQEWLVKAARRNDVRIDVPWVELDSRELALAIDGESVKPPARKGAPWQDRERYPGVRGFFRWLEGKRYKTHVRILLARYRGYTPCQGCAGARLRPEALAVRIEGRNIAELLAWSIGDLLAWSEGLELDAARSARGARLLADVRRRLAYLRDVGLDYLTLARQARTLSGGEAQRIHLASALGSALTDTLYCLDEPTVGLHARDSERLLAVLRNLTQAGNTVVLVEHDPSVILGADHVLDLGPGGGLRGGEVVFSGTAAELRRSDGPTGRSLARRKAARPAAQRPPAGSAGPAPKRTRPAGRGRGKAASPAATPQLPGEIVIRGARENNLRGITARIPTGRLVCVTGVSGSGKSTLVEQVLYNGWLRHQGTGAEDGACDGIDGLDRFHEVVLMSQAPVGRSARSNPATYLKAWDEIRSLFAATMQARAEKILPGSFSFNSGSGRCETCEGMGTVTIEMHFMADLVVGCEACGGRRFRPHVLAVRFRGRSIDEVLGMTIDEAFEFFATEVRVRSRLAALRAVGLGYLTLGQPTSTLSGGEAQRLKLASFVDESLEAVVPSAPETDGEAEPARAGDAVVRRAAARLLVFDEPTTGLHLNDVERLVDVLHGIVARGTSVIVVEHNVDFIAAADYVIDLGPEGGDAGGEIVAEGSPLELATRGDTWTGRALREVIDVKSALAVPASSAAKRPARPARASRRRSG